MHLWLDAGQARQLPLSSLTTASAYPTFIKRNDWRVSLRFELAWVLD
ncbi:hypothetical protein [Novipirellula caenicola]